MVALQGLFSHHSNLFEAGFEQKRVDVAHRLDERMSHLHGLCSKSKILPQTEQQPALGRNRHAISNTSSLTATTRTPSLQISHSARRLEQFGNQSNYSTRGASHDSLRLCGSTLLDAPSAQGGRDILRPCGPMCWLSTSTAEVDGGILFSSGSIPPSNTPLREAQPYGVDTNHSILGHRVETTHQTERSTVGGRHRRDIDFHISKIHEIEQQGSSLSETSTTESSQADHATSIQFESYEYGSVPAVSLDSSRSIKLNHSLFTSQSPHSVSEHPNSALSRVQKEGTRAHGVDVTQLVCNLRDLVELKKINVGLELQGASSAEVDKQRQYTCDHQSALLQKLERELEQAKRDLVVEREGVVQLHRQIQKLQLEVNREKEHSSSQEIQLRDAFEEIKQQKDSSTTMSFALPHAEICQQTGSVFRKFTSSLDQTGLKVSQRKAKLQQVTRTCDGLQTKQYDTHNLISDLQPKMDAQAQKKIRDEHAYLKQVEVMLGKAVEEIKHKSLQVVEDPTGASHLHLDHATIANQSKWLVGFSSSPECSGKESRLQICRDWLTSRAAAPTTPPAQDYCFTKESYFG